MLTTLRANIKNAMIAKKNNPNIEAITKYQTYKNILETAQKIAKDKRIDITDSIIIDAAKKEIKQLNDLKQYCTNNEDKLHEVNIGIETASEMLPAMISESEIIEFINSHKTADSNIGSMMKLLKSTFGDSLDGKIASKLVRENL